MKCIFDLLSVDLTLFDGEGGGEGGAQGAAADSGEAQAGTKAPGSSRREKKSGGLDNVVYGRQAESTATPPAAESKTDSDAGSEQTETTLEEKRAKFRELVKGEFKDVYTEDTQSIINRRFKDVKATEEAVATYKPVLDTLFAKYKIEDGDIAKLNAAIENDDAYWSASAEEAGMSVEQYKQFAKLQRENQVLKQAQQQTVQQQQAQAQLQKWYTEADAVKAEYPDFDFTAECQNPNFIAMLKNGVPVKHAYEVAHLDDIKARTAQTTAQKTEKQVVDNIRAKGTRPAENGVSSQSGITFKADASKLTKEDRAEIARRVQRGEQITF